MDVTQQDEAIFTLLGQVRLVPVVVLGSAGPAGRLADALLAGGLPCAEVTFRTDAAVASIRAMSGVAGMTVGAGTVTHPDQVAQAVEAGARFIVSPGFSSAVVAACRRHGVPVIPGAATATEMQMAIEAGLGVVKFFPAAAAGGLATLRALSAPFPALRFVPTGGITDLTAPDYLAHPSVLAVGGSWMVGSQLSSPADFAEVTRRTRRAMELTAASAEHATVAGGPR